MVQSKTLLSCTTAHVSALSQRAQEAKATALRLTFDALHDLMELARTHIEALFALADGSALLDVLVAFAERVSLNPSGFVRPIIHDETNKIQLAGARHPVVAESSTFAAGGGGNGFVSNDISLDPAANFVLVTGPNGSGKSVFVKQVALCIIMTQIGMFVPAKSAVMPLLDRIVARIGCSDDLQYNMSTFRGEMKELAYLTSNITPRSLVLVDELGKGTGHMDGISLAFSAAEWLLSRKAITLFITHFPQLTLLPDMYPNARSIHMRTAECAGIQFLYQPGEGPSSWQTGYGVAMARTCGFPTLLVRRAESLQAVVRHMYPLTLSAGVDNSLSAVTQLLQYLLLLGVSTMDDSVFRNALASLQARVPAAALTTLLALLNSEPSIRTAESTIVVSPSRPENTANILFNTAETPERPIKQPRNAD